MILCLTDAEDLGLVDNIPPYLLWARAYQTKIDLWFSEAIDTLSAQKTTSYFINGLTIEKATLHSDQQSVELQVSSIDTEQTYSLVVLGIKDQSTNQNTQMGQVVPLIIADPFSFPIKINAGGGAIYGEYLTDKMWGPSVEYGYMDGHPKDWTTSVDITGTEQDSLYIADLQGAVKYKVRVPEGIYSIVFHFAENEYNENGQRVFEIVIEDSIVAGHIDLFYEAGQYAAYDIEVRNIPVLDGIMDIHLNNWVGYSILNGLTIEQESTGIEGIRSGAIEGFKLFQNYPNPFNPSTVINYQLSTSSQVNLTVYNVLGQKVRTLQDQKQNSGYHAIPFSAAGLASGIYYYQLKTQSGFSQTGKMILIN